MTTSLVVVDMQRVFADAGSAWATPGYATASAGVRRLLPAFAGATVFTRFVAPPRPGGGLDPLLPGLAGPAATGGRPDLGHHS